VVQQAIHRAKEGDQEALRFLYVRYADNVYGYVTSIVRDEHEAEDITQQVFTKLLTVLPRYEQREVPFSAWILRVARNVAVDHLRARRPIPAEDPRPVDARSDQTGSDYGRSLRQALEALPDDQRTVVVMRHVVGLSPTEIAAEMGKTESSVHGLHNRARGTLRRALTELECAPATVEPSSRRRKPADPPAVVAA
jgi:RNA polymerase sigma-70 factor (ECF subfamily)